MVKTLAIIPARYASTRFPGKPLVEIAGKSMIQHVWERAMQTPSIDEVLVEQMINVFWMQLKNLEQREC